MSQRSNPKDSIYVVISKDTVTALSDGNWWFNLAIGVKDSSGGLNWKIIDQQEVTGAFVDFSWDEKYQLSGSLSQPASNSPSQLDIDYQQSYNVAADGSSTVSDAPNCPINSFYYLTAIESQATLYQSINNSYIPIFISPNFDPSSTPYVITPTQTFKVWFSNQNGDNKTQELVIDYTNLVSQIVSYASSGWSFISPSSYTVGGIFGISLTDQGYVVTQEKREPWSLMPPVDNVESRYSFSWGFGPILVEGYIDIEQLEIGVDLKVFGFDIGQFYGNLNEGLVIKLDLIVARGEIKFYLKNGNEVWIKVDVNILGIGGINRDEKIFTLPILPPGIITRGHGLQIGRAHV